jgi:hypothetical protein
MIITAKHMEPTQNSPAAAYGHRYMYNGFGGSAQASHGVSPRHTVTESGSSAWITDGSGNACTERSRSVNQYLAYMPFGESFIDQRNGNDIRFIPRLRSAQEFPRCRTNTTEVTALILSCSVYNRHTVRLGGEEANLSTTNFLSD